MIASDVVLPNNCKDSHSTKRCFIYELCDLDLEKYLGGSNPLFPRHHRFQPNDHLMLMMSEKECKRIVVEILKGTFSRFTWLVAPLIAVATGLCYLHECDVAHRDLKPGNILLVKGDDGIYHVKICDFGYGKQIPGTALNFVRAKSPSIISHRFSCRGTRFEHDLPRWHTILYRA